MSALQLQTLVEFYDQLAHFFSALDDVSHHWQESAGDSTGNRDDECQSHREIAFDARNRIKLLAPRVIAAMTPPPGVTATQFLANLLNDVDSAWHLCRFVHCIQPDVPEDCPDFERIRNEMHQRLPVLRNNLWEAWRHIGFSIQLGRAAAAAPKPTTGERASATGEVADARISQERSKRSTERGEGRAKLVGALTKHHEYADGGCLNLTPIGVNELARKAEVASSTATEFFNREFSHGLSGGHKKYRQICMSDASLLVACLKALNGEFSPHHLYGTTPPREKERED